MPEKGFSDKSYQCSVLRGFKKEKSFLDFEYR